MGPRQLTANNADWMKRMILNIFFTIPRAIFPKPSLCGEITVTKSLVRGQLT